MNVPWQEFSTRPENDRLDNNKIETRATANVRKLKSPLDWGMCSMERVWSKSTKYNLPPHWGSSSLCVQRHTVLLCSFTWDRSPRRVQKGQMRVNCFPSYPFQFSGGQFLKVLISVFRCPNLGME